MMNLFNMNYYFLFFGLFMVVVAITGLAKTNAMIKSDKISQQIKHLTKLQLLNVQHPQFVQPQKKGKNAQMQMPQMSMGQAVVPTITNKDSIFATIGKAVMFAVVFFFVLRLLQFLF